MPREFVFGTEPVVAETALPDDQRPVIGRDENGNLLVMVEEGLVSVGWSSEAGHVQVATLTRDTVSKETRQEGVYIDLDRRGINDLIRHLRRARDQAFGRDA
jgi:hypothetical protein